MNFEDLNQMEKVTRMPRRELARFGVAGLFTLLIVLLLDHLHWLSGTAHTLLLVTAIMSVYLLINLGANDIASYVGTVSGAGAVSVAGLVLIVVLFELVGAWVAGDRVMLSIQSHWIDVNDIADSDRYVMALMAALLSAAVWLNVAHLFQLPVSTTHAVVGAMAGSLVAATGFDFLNWYWFGVVLVSWIVTPFLGAVLAALLLFWIKRSITYQSNMIKAAQARLPLMLALLMGCFVTYLYSKLWLELTDLRLLMGAVLGGVAGVVCYGWLRYFLIRAGEGRHNNKETINRFFVIPLLVSIAVLSFAHGSNDLSNALGVVMAIYQVLSPSDAMGVVDVPFSIYMVIGFGIAIGLALFGSQLMSRVGQEITELDAVRAFAIATSAAFTVMVASELGIAVSTTYIALGALLGVGFLRERIKSSYALAVQVIHEYHDGRNDENYQLYEYLRRFKQASFKEKRRMLKELSLSDSSGARVKKFQKTLHKAYRKELVKRSIMIKVLTAWTVTLPVSAMLSVVVYFVMRGIQAG